MSKLRILIGGGSGFVGKALTSSLRSQGHKVTIISTRGTSPSALTWDDIKRDGLPASTDAVINLAGANILDLKKLWTSAYKEECLSSRVDTTTTLAHAIAETDTPPSVWISTSAVGFYPPCASTNYDEASVVADDSRDWASDLCASIEKAAVIPDSNNQSPNSNNQSHTRSVVMRTGVVFGKGGGAFQNMRLPFLAGLGGPFGNGSHWFPFVHLTDVVRAFEFAITDPRPQGPLNLVAPHACTNLEFTKTLGAAMHRPTFIPVPRLLATFIGHERAALLFDGQRVTPAALTDLGFDFTYPDADSCCAELVA